MLLRSVKLRGMNHNNHITRFFVIFCLSFLPLVAACAQELRPNEISAGSEDNRCFEKNYRHKTARQLARMTPEQLIDESTKEWNYHVSLMDKYGMFTIHTYTGKIGIAIAPVLTKLAESFGLRPNSRCQQERFFTALAIAADVDNQIVRLRNTMDGKAAISAAVGAIQRMKNAGLANPDTNPYNKYEFGRTLLTTLNGINEHDELIRNLLVSEFQLHLSDQEFLSFVEYLTSTYPIYPSWTRVGKNGARDLQENKNKYHNAYLEFKKAIRTSNPPSDGSSDQKTQAE